MQITPFSFPSDLPPQLTQTVALSWRLKVFHGFIHPHKSVLVQTDSCCSHGATNTSSPSDQESILLFKRFLTLLLPVQYKILLLSFRTIHTPVPSYLPELIHF